MYRETDINDIKTDASVFFIFSHHKNITNVNMCFRVMKTYIIWQIKFT